MPTWREDAVCGNRVYLGHISLAIVRLLRDTIDEQGRSAREKDRSVERKGIGSNYGGIAARAGMSYQRRRRCQSKRHEQQGDARFHWCLQIFLGGCVGPTQVLSILRLNVARHNGERL